MAIVPLPQRHLLAVDGDRAGVGVQHPGQDFHQRRLAGAVGPQEGVHLTRRDREVDRAQGDDGAEGLGGRGGLEQGLVHVGRGIGGALPLRGRAPDRWSQP